MTRPRRIAANGIRLAIEEFRPTDAPTLKNGKPGKTKVTYGEVDDAAKWLWPFVDGAKTARELFGRVLVVFATGSPRRRLAQAQAPSPRATDGHGLAPRSTTRA